MEQQTFVFDSQILDIILGGIILFFLFFAAMFVFNRFFDAMSAIARCVRELLTPSPKDFFTKDRNMPCRDGGPSDTDTAHKSEREIDKVTRLLCHACTVLQRAGHNFAENPELNRWWDQHKKEDEQRKIAEDTKRKEIESVKALLQKPAGELTRDEWDLIEEHRTWPEQQMLARRHR